MPLLINPDQNDTMCQAQFEALKNFDDFYKNYNKTIVPLAQKERIHQFQRIQSDVYKTVLRLSWHLIHDAPWQYFHITLFDDESLAGSPLRVTPDLTQYSAMIMPQDIDTFINQLESHSLKYQIVIQKTNPPESSHMPFPKAIKNTYELRVAIATISSSAVLIHEFLNATTLDQMPLLAQAFSQKILPEQARHAVNEVKKLIQ